jgi:hypothetical protein
MINYNFFSKFLHDFILSNKFINKSLYEFEKLIFLKKTEISLNKHVFITGLPRSGTTVLLNYIYASNLFASFKYSNMPLILAPNISKMIPNRKIPKKERLHQDGITFDLDSPEAFDEIFFSTFNDEETKEELINYLRLLLLSQNKTKYLSKNNLNYKRIHKIKSILPNSLFLIPIREPEAHSQSLYNQNKNFCELQKKDDFIRRYMNYLGHNEFGLNHKPWNSPDKYKEETNKNYWLEQWIMFYEYIYKIYGSDKNCMFVIYEKLPSEKTILKISKFIDIKFNKYGFLNQNKTQNYDNFDKNLVQKAKEIYFKFFNHNNSN